jgi:hypothetical protein
MIEPVGEEATPGLPPLTEDLLLSRGPREPRDGRFIVISVDKYRRDRRHHELQLSRGEFRVIRDNLRADAVRINFDQTTVFNWRARYHPPTPGSDLAVSFKVAK